MKINFFFALSLVLFAACLVLDILDVVRCRKRERRDRQSPDARVHSAHDAGDPVRRAADVLNERIPDACVHPGFFSHFPEWAVN